MKKKKKVDQKGDGSKRSIEKRQDDLEANDLLEPAPRPSCKGPTIPETKADFSGHLAQEGREESSWLATEWDKLDQPFSLKPLSAFLHWDGNDLPRDSSEPPAAHSVPPGPLPSQHESIMSTQRCFRHLPCIN